MFGFNGTIRGDGLVRIHRALDELEEDQQKLDRFRERFDKPPPPYASHSSGTPTRSASPELPRDEQEENERRERQFQRRRRLMDERGASLPLEQFKAQWDEEKTRIWNANPRTNWMSKIPFDGLEEREAIQLVRKRWVEQGIWKDKWNDMAAGDYRGVGRWKHEEPLELEAESETDTEAELPPPVFSFFPQRHSKRKARQPKSEDEKQRIAERNALRAREREASRPYHQFVYQITKERERIQDESEDKEAPDAADINTRAYENVKDIWTRRGIWNKGWGILPGMSWKHEAPLEDEETADDASPAPTNHVQNHRNEAEEQQMPRFTFSFGSNTGHVSGILNPSQETPSAHLPSKVLENGEDQPSSSNLISPPPGTTRRAVRFADEQTLPPGKRKEGRLGRQLEDGSPGPDPSSKSSRAVTKRKRSQGLPEDGASDSLQLSAEVEATPQSSSSLPPRRSKRIRQSGPSLPNAPSGTASSDHPRRAVRAKTEGKKSSSLAAQSSAKPLDTSKKQSPKVKRGKGKRK